MRGPARPGARLKEDKGESVCQRVRDERKKTEEKNHSLSLSLSAASSSPSS